MKARRSNKPICHFVALMALCLLPLAVTASVTVMDSGERYKSRADHHYGRAFHRGYEYMARLQFLEDNLSLCPPPNEQETYNLTHVPLDELPGECLLLATVAHLSGLRRTELFENQPEFLINTFFCFGLVSCLTSGSLGDEHGLSTGRQS